MNNQKIDKLFNNLKFDLIFSIGETCYCATYLRAHELRDFSAPFDWLYGAGYLQRIQILKNRFDRFFELEDLSFSHHVENENRDDYKNNYTQLSHCHDFEYNSNLSKEYTLVKKKFDRRISRLLNKIEKSKRVLIVYMENPDTKEKVKDGELIESVDCLKQEYGEKIHILYFAHNDNFKNGQIEIKRICEQCVKITLFNRDLETPVNTGNYPIIKIFLNNLKLKRTLTEKIKKNIYEARNSLIVKFNKNKAH